MESSASIPRPTLDVALHTKYWQRCLKSLLPTEYQTTDSNRLMLAWLILAALDVLGCGASTFPRQEREGLRKWILDCQHPNGGFCGSPNHKYPRGYYARQRDIDPANLGASFFAILSLGFVGGLEQVQRAKTLRWLKKLQREDGSFGELIEASGRIGGGRDMRYCHLASGIRRLLRGDEGSKRNREVFEDIDVDKLVGHIRAGETYDGGIAESSEHEAHAGYTYCAAASLSFLDRLPPSVKSSTDSNTKLTGLKNVPATIKWLISRQTPYEDEDDLSDDEGIGAAEPPPDSHSSQDVPSLVHLSMEEEAEQIGCNGRCNKKADTCYCFYVGATLKILGKDRLVNKEGFRRFLLEQTQHRIGGFGKCPGHPPDLYHSYLGLATLSIMGEPGLKAVDPELCITLEAKERLESSIQKLSAERDVYFKNGLIWTTSELDTDYEKNLAEDEGPTGIFGPVT